MGADAVAARLMRLPLPGRAPHAVVVPAPGDGDGWWAGAPSAAVDPDGGIALAYRVRRGHDERGGTVVVALSADGEAFEPVAEITKDRFGAESLERPALVALPGGGWRLYVSCARPNTKHWWVEALDAPTLAGLAGEAADRTRRTVWPGDERTAVKDPVVRVDDRGRWVAWLCCHPLDTAGAEDRMWSAEVRGDDGLTWSEPVVGVEPRAGTWDARGTRVTAVLGEGWVAYDGRASAEENFRERTGVARVFQPDRERVEPVADVRYLDVLPLPEGGHRLYYEAPLPGGSHELRTEHHAPPPERVRRGADLPYPLRDVHRVALLALTAGIVAAAGWVLDRIDLPGFLAPAGLGIVAVVALLAGTHADLGRDEVEPDGELVEGMDRRWVLGFGGVGLLVAILLLL